MKRSFNVFSYCLLIALCVIRAALSAYGQSSNSSTSDPGVVINGVKWATRNVDAPGTFAAKPESPGMFYQWNRKKAWPATGAVTDWDIGSAPGATWEKSNDPSPAGWRVPTFDEIRTLLDTSKVRMSEGATQNGIKGLKFTDKTTGNTLFLPNAGSRLPDDGIYLDRDKCAVNYWSSTQWSGHMTNDIRWSSTQEIQDIYDVYLLCAGTPGFALSTRMRDYGFSVRAVADNNIDAETDPQSAALIREPYDEESSLSARQSAAPKNSATEPTPRGKNVSQQPDDRIEGVVINGVKWATRNVDIPGTFAASPESPGMIYQWNRKKAWSATGAVTGSGSSRAVGTTWEKSNDPSPAGWRVPTIDELRTLLETDKVGRIRSSQNGINGVKFTDKTTGNTLFLPDGAPYWSSSPHTYSARVYANVYYLSTHPIKVADTNYDYGQSIRSVADNNIEAETSTQSAASIREPYDEESSLATRQSVNPPPPGGNGKLSVTVNTRNADITIEGAGTQKSHSDHVTALELPVGSYSVTVSKAGYRTVTRQVNLSAGGASVSVALESTYAGPNSGTLVWEGDVRGATTVTIDGGNASEGRVSGSLLPGVPCSVRLSDSKNASITVAPGPENNYKGVTIQINSKGRERVRVTLNWTVSR